MGGERGGGGVERQGGGGGGPALAPKAAGCRGGEEVPDLVLRALRPV